MSQLLHRMQQWRQGMGVRRFHTCPTVGEQTVGHHSCGVALIIVMCHPAPSPALLMAALTHDLSEGVLGDLPATTKWRSHVLQAEWYMLEQEVEMDMGVRPTHPLPDADKLCLLVADDLEGLLWCCEQLRLGNENYRIVARRWAERLDCVLKGNENVIPPGFEELFIEVWNTLLGYPDQLQERPCLT